MTRTAMEQPAGSQRIITGCLKSSVRENPADPQSMSTVCLILCRPCAKAYSIREQTGMSANHYIQEVRLQMARELLESGVVANIRDLAVAVGLRIPD